MESTKVAVDVKVDATYKVYIIVELGADPSTKFIRIQRYHPITLEVKCEMPEHTTPDTYITSFV